MGSKRNRFSFLAFPDVTFRTPIKELGPELEYRAPIRRQVERDGHCTHITLSQKRDIDLSTEDEHIYSYWNLIIVDSGLSMN